MRLLLAEDEKEMSNALVAILKHNNYSVDVVYDGKEALDYLQNGTYDGVILDIMMPKLDGISVLKQIRAEGNQVPVLLLTAKSQVDDMVNGLDSGADDYLAKPFDTRILLARIRAMTRRVNDVTDAILKCENVTLDRSTYMLEVAGTSVRLASKEYQMMEMLMTNQGRIVSVDMLFEKIWGLDSDAEQNVVWVNISYLRKKLQSMNANVQIKAVRGLGYILEKKYD